MNKRGQAAVFIVVGIVILSAVGLAVFVGANYTKSNFLSEITKLQSVPAEIQPIKEVVDSCLDEVSIEGLVILGRRGGYYEMPSFSEVDFGIESYENSSTFFLDLRPYYLINSKIIFPKLEDTEKNYEKYVSDRMLDCVDNFNEFRAENYSFIVRRPVVDANFKKNIVLNVEFPIAISKKGMSFNLNTFSSRVDFNFVDKYNLVESAINEQKKDVKSFPLGFITNLAYEKEFRYEINELGNNTKLLKLRFNEENLDDFKEFEYGFLLKYE